ncbi:LPS O-antigen subunit length determinant protein (WzzB/FepE family) [Rhodothalassium salexigens DSM 2132]|uniref:LPS O-antigen subunit length determinant protein (WzzB/FepE family) n=1 Tax=Rhodothalassium salexigens DSM 2132 TaxID=1188247 RepID=A0A4V2SNK2_RHOSA|nr:Wzz/FepE/Etk N-terminal domain-containing protein [Rhodothalassium salexigens]MBB4212472.1 capsular polysaccharide biosynthesis protein [Rhodothalassium salexigens DSM 2132]TCP31486.1 LPS O-antigen subunit length determinant protein (WzzB/FepE family) [Rhodothalassium salexigens DSM 2132]
MLEKKRDDLPGLCEARSSGPSDEPRPPFSLGHILRDLLNNWHIIIVSVFFLVVLVSFYLWTANPEYTAELQVFPNSEVQEQLELGVGGFGSSLNPFRSSTVEEATVLERYLAAITSIGVAEELMAIPEVAHTAFVSQWGAEDQKWHPPGGAIASLKSFLYRFYGLPDWQPPDARDLSGYINRKVSITSFTAPGAAKAIGYVLSYSSKDPEFAQNFLTHLHREANRVVLQQERSRALERAAYLQDRLKQARTKDVVETLSELLIENERKLMMMVVDDSFAAMPLEPVRVSKLPTSPKPLLVLVLAIVLGFMAGAAIVLLRNVLRP